MASPEPSPGTSRGTEVANPGLDRVLLRVPGITGMGAVQGDPLPVTSKHGLLRGPKFNMRHSTIIEPALPFVQMLKASPAVTKISLGVIKPVTSSGARKGGSHQVKALVLPRAVRFSFRGGSSVQQFHVFGPDLNAIAELGADWP